MKRVLSSILISFIVLANLFAPISVGINKSGVEVKKNEVVAVDCEIKETTWSPEGGVTVLRPSDLTLNIKTVNCIDKSLFLKLTEINGENKIVANVSNVIVTKNDFSINFKPGEEFCEDNHCEIELYLALRNPTSIFGETTLTSDNILQYKCTTEDCNNSKPWSYSLEPETKIEGEYNFDITPVVKTTDKTAEIELTIKNNTVSTPNTIAGTTIVSKLSTKVDIQNIDRSSKDTQTKEMTKEGGVEKFSFSNLLSDKDYIVKISIIENSIITTTAGGAPSNTSRTIATAPDKTIHTNKEGVTTLVDQGAVDGIKMSQNNIKNDSNMPSCGITNPMGCVAQFFYYVLFVPTSYLFAMSGVFFDSTFAYSVQDTSYRSSFVVEGWGLVRDFCNMFFIFILLYVAIGTTLSLHGFKTKETIINVIIIGLVINFSLFATQLIIDASNITARVFYNADTIKITEKGVDGAATVISEVGEGGVIPLSAALVNKINPQNLILQSKAINNIPDKGGASATDENKGNIGVSSFILITIIASAVNIVGFIVFLSVGMMFVARVIGLWLAMIIAPLAFFTYILPDSMAGTKMIGWKNWWPETFKLAFLAPVFIFFMYLILKFLEMDLISDSAGRSVTDVQSGLNYFVATLIPFAFIMILMLKAKEIAKDMSGEIGQQITSKLSMAGGLALGAATGGAALLGRGTIGRLANKANNSNWLNDAASGKKGKMMQFLGKAGKSTANYTAKSSFDVRQTKAGSAFSKETGLNLDTGTNYLGLDSNKTAGGYVAQQQRKLEKENKFKDNLGYDHHKYEEVGDEIAEKEAALAKYKADITVNHKSKEYQAKVAADEYEIANKKKEQERVKSGRAMEYALTSKRKSGKIYDIDMTEKYVESLKNKYEKETDLVKKEKLRKDYEHAEHAFHNKTDYRDNNGNIKRFGHANSDGARASKQIIKEFAKGVAQGAATGGIAGSIVPGIGTGIGLVGGGLAGGIRGLMHYSGTTNRKVGEEHNTTEKFTNNYKAPSGGGGDSHAKTDAHKEEHHDSGESTHDEH